MRTLRWALACLLVASGLHAQRVTVTLLATTDLHGAIYPYDYYTRAPAQRGLAKIASLVSAVRGQTRNVLLIDCGDTIQGSPLESVYQHYVRTGRLPLGMKAAGPTLVQDPMMLVMNEMGYEAMVLGNHEFNFGLKNLAKARSEARFPWLSANTVAGPASGVKPFQPYLVKTVAGVKVAIIGITTPSIPSWEVPENYRGLKFRPGVEAAADTVKLLRERERPDLVVAAVHAGLGDTGENMVTGIASRVPGIDAVVFGHSHQREAGRQIGNVLVVQPQNGGASLARLDFDMEKQSQGWKRAARRSELIPVRPETPADPRILELAKPYHDAAERYLDRPVAESVVDLDGSLGRVQDSALVDAIHEVQLHYARADVSFTALFNPRVRMPKGPVTVRQIAALYLYDNELYAIEGDGRMVEDALENAARFYLSCRNPSCDQGPLVNRAVMGYNYDMAQGVTYEVDLTQPPGRRIRNLAFQGRPLDPGRKLRIAVNNYRAAGSAGY
ncbi:MAG TPA: bifunctional UDP-sugar hydrolase/5'-nucleotidase, partial [Bryobacteraceae bacterium]|nr:bifunctional UDP-sugar hydrolase/5'-nucleotidase [Bryobacteraceae bacterium]